MKRIVLEGALGERFGSEFNLDVASPREAMVALGHQLPGFRLYMKDEMYNVFAAKGDKIVSLGVEQASLQGDFDTIFVIPDVAGAIPKWLKRVGGIVLGVVLGVVAAPFIGAALLGGGATAAFAAGVVRFVGTALILNGVASILGLTPKKPGGPSAGEVREEETSHIFNGPINQQGQGQSVPIAVGRIRVGSIVVSAGISPEKELLEPKVPGSAFSPTASYIAATDGGVAIPRPSGGSGIISSGAGEVGGQTPSQPSRPSVGRQQLGIKRGSGPTTRGGDRGSGGSGRGASGGNPGGTTGSGGGGFSR